MELADSARAASAGRHQLRLFGRLIDEYGRLLAGCRALGRRILSDRRVAPTDHPTACERLPPFAPGFASRCSWCRFLRGAFCHPRVNSSSIGGTRKPAKLRRPEGRKRAVHGTLQHYFWLNSSSSLFFPFVFVRIVPFGVGVVLGVGSASSSSDSRDRLRLRRRSLPRHLPRSLKRARRLRRPILPRRRRRTGRSDSSSRSLGSSGSGTMRLRRGGGEVAVVAAAAAVFS